MTSSPVPVSQASVGFERGVGQEFEYLDCKVTLLSIVEQGTTQIVRYRIEESGGRSASYTAWPNQASHQRPQPSPSGHVLVHVTGVFDSNMAVFQVFSAAALDPDGVFVHAKDDETFNYAGISITSRHTRVKRTMSGGHVTLATLVVEEKGKTSGIADVRSGRNAAPSLPGNRYRCYTQGQTA